MVGDSGFITGDKYNKGFVGMPSGQVLGAWCFIRIFENIRKVLFLNLFRPNFSYTCNGNLKFPLSPHCKGLKRILYFLQQSWQQWDNAMPTLKYCAHRISQRMYFLDVKFVLLRITSRRHITMDFQLALASFCSNCRRWQGEFWFCPYFPFHKFSLW